MNILGNFKELFGEQMKPLDIVIRISKDRTVRFGDFKTPIFKLEDEFKENEYRDMKTVLLKTMEEKPTLFLCSLIGALQDEAIKAHSSIKKTASTTPQ